jgi:uncharacterized protein (DUF1778 family)
MKTTQSARLELRLPRQKKEYFEEVAALGGFKSLSDFIMDSANQMADKIAEEHSKILATERDRNIFFDTLMNPPKPNQALKKAFKKYNESLKSK